MAPGKEININIPLQRPTPRQDILANIEAVLMSGWWTEGEWTKRFEEAVRDYVGANHAIAVPNATVGMEMVVRYLVREFGKSAFIIPAYTHPATAQAVINGGGGFPFFCDINPRTGLMSTDCLENYVLSGMRKIVIPVSLFGNPIVDWNFRKSFDGFILEDAACSLGSKNADGDYVGSKGTAVFSFHPRKIISTGEGGMIVTNDNAIAEFCRKYKNFGGIEYDDIGTNYKMTDILGAVGVSQMEDLSWILLERQLLAKRYNERLANLEHEGYIRFLQTTGIPNYQSYVIDLVHGYRLDLRVMLKERGIETQIGSHYLPGLKFFRDNNWRMVKFPEAKYAYEHYLTLPLYPAMTLADQDKVISALYDAMGEKE